MGGSRKSKKVTWASDFNLCQVRLFSAEECPSEVGIQAQDHLKAKVLFPVQSGGMESDDNLPPGFESIQLANLWRVKLSQIPLTKWKCPPRFEVNSNWQVVAGEESVETEAQNQREIRTLEAIYPRPSAIPSNPAESMGVEDSSNIVQNTPVIPISPIEAEDAALDASYASMPANSNAMIQQPQSLPNRGSATVHPHHVNEISATSVEHDIVAAAQSGLTSGTLNSALGNLIDHKLLIKLLSNPKMVEQLVTNYGTQHMSPHMRYSSHETRPSTAMPNVKSSITQNMSLSGMHNMPCTSTTHADNLRPMQKNSFAQINTRDPLSANITRPHTAMQNVTSSITQTTPLSSMHNLACTRTQHEPIAPLNTRDPLSAKITRPEATLPFYPTTNPRPSVGIPMIKDVDYYRSLIQQHGGEKRESLTQFSYTIQEPFNITNSKVTKPCMYFNSSRGCRNGANCTNHHDISSHHIPTAKRMKLSREITGA